MSWVNLRMSWWPCASDRSPTATLPELNTRAPTTEIEKEQPEDLCKRPVENERADHDLLR
jgi:hypothetical protein